MIVVLEGHQLVSRSVEVRSTDHIHYVLDRLSATRNESPESQELFVAFLVTGTEALTERDLDSAVGLRVAALLRLLAINEQIVYRSKHRREALELIDRRLQQQVRSLREKYGLTGREQADEQCRRLAALAPDADEQLEEAAHRYSGLQSLRAVRESLMKCLNSDLANPTIKPFLPDGARAVEQLRACLTAAIDYTEAGAGEAGGALESAQSKIEGLIGSPSYQSNTVLAPIKNVLVTILKELRDNYHASPYSKPAVLTLDASVRRHPLHLKHHVLSIPLMLNNVGDGVALDVEVEMTAAIGLVPSGVPTRVQRVEPGRMVLEVRSTTNPDEVSEGEHAFAEFEVSWGNPDGTVGNEKFEALIRPQDWSVDWELLQENNPYSLEAVHAEADLIGRGAVLKRIAATLSTRNIGSLYIHGQKRVGKTSLARVALNQVKARSPEITCVYEDIGGYPADPGGAVDTLTRNLVHALDDYVGLRPDARNFTPDGSLSSLISVLRSLSRQDKRIIIAIDEFDRLPVTLFRRNGLGDSFFTGLRTIANIDGVGLILIGGERMRLIVNAGGVELNLFSAFPVDYLDRNTQWAEFEELVRKPTEGRLEYTDEACSVIYEYTAGNPYYTKLLCGQILESAATRRDAYVDGREVEAAVEMLLGRLDPTSFAHYWEDFMLEQDDKRDEITLQRRRCLKAIGAVQRPAVPMTSDEAVEAAVKMGLDSGSAHRVIDEFISRELFTRNGDSVVARVRLFERWLKERGPQQIVIAGAELEAEGRAEQHREQLRITFDDAVALTSRWGTYKGQEIRPDQLLDYLKQFDSLEDQRLVYKVLSAIRFLDDGSITKSLQAAWSRIVETLKTADGTWSQPQIRLSYISAPGKSSLTMARIFAGANKLLKDTRGIVGPESLRELATQGLKDVIIVDDFVGTGSTVCDALPVLAQQVPENVRLHFVAAAGTVAGFEVVDGALREHFGERANFYEMYQLPERAEVFGPDSSTFLTQIEATEALEVLRRVGSKLLPTSPLGFGDSCSLVVFSTTIPNNAPPVLWKESTGNFTFRPLFPRN